jgi:AraC-like DNA-binding protein
MKPFYSKIDMDPQESFSIRHNFLPDFKGLWHYHPEIELHYVIHGEGVRFIGDNISNFSAGDMVFIGENLPHCWRYNNDAVIHSTQAPIETLVLHFKPDCLGPYLNNLHEAFQLPILYEKAKRGMLISGQAKAELIILMNKLLRANGLQRVILLLSVLKALAQNQDYNVITLAEHHFFPSEDSDMNRLEHIRNYTLTNFRRNISLKEVAASSNLNESSFCRYFKTVTKNKYSSFLIQIRISQACQQLIQNRQSTNAICYDCGFNNVSNFYRHFKKITGMTPLDYRKKHIKNYIRKIAS